MNKMNMRRINENRRLFESLDSTDLPILLESRYQDPDSWKRSRIKAKRDELFEHRKTLESKVRASIL